MKCGREPINDPRKYGYRVRLNSRENEILQYLISSKINVSKLLRDALETEYAKLKERADNVI